MKAMMIVVVALMTVCVNEAASSAVNSNAAHKETENVAHKVNHKEAHKETHKETAKAQGGNALKDTRAQSTSQHKETRAQITTQHKEAEKTKITSQNTEAGKAKSTTHHKAKITPVQKVLEMMKGMMAKGSEEKHLEEVQFAAYKQFCDDTKADKEKSIQEALALMEVLSSEIEKASAVIEKLSEEIAEHEEDIRVWGLDMKAATKVRAIEKADFEKLHMDYTESVDACNSAIATLKKQQYDRPQEAAAAFIQVIKQLKKSNLAKHIPTEARQKFAEFLAEDAAAKDSSFLEAPEANAYEFQSTSIIDMLEKLEDKFFAERNNLEKAETTSKDSYELLMNDLKVSTKQATNSMNEKSEAKSKTQMTKAGKEGDLKSTTADKDEDVKYLNDLVASCGKKSRDFESRQELREEELETLQQAITIIDNEAVKGNADKYLPSFVQKGSTALVQMREHSLTKSDSDEQQEQAKLRFVKFLQGRAVSLHSRVLATLATRVAIEADPFLKVKKMIKDMIVRLEDEALEEAEHKGWCDKELATNKNTRESLTDEIETLAADIDALDASITKLADEIAALSKAVTELDEKMYEAGQLRIREKDKNAATVKDAKDAQAAVAQALVVLKEFYSKASGATAFVQQAAKGSQTPPEIFDGAYTGMQGENGGVVGMLEVIESDFARLEAETGAAEVLAVKEYEQFISDSKVDKEGKETLIDHKVEKKGDEETLIATKKEDKFAAEKQLEVKLAYFERLKEDCLAENVNYEDRVKQRESEIESLQEALKILSGEDLA